MRQPFLHRVDNYDDLWKQMDYRSIDIPPRFNLGVACVDDQDPGARALTIVRHDRTSTDYTFGEVRDQANRLANGLRGLGIGRATSSRW